MKYSIFALIISLLMLVGCGSDSDTAVAEKPTETTTNAEKSTPVAAQKTMMFFLNPNGGPCKRQKQILTAMNDQLQANNIKIQYVSTQKMDTDGIIFQQYGIRALPTLIVLDENGTEKKRFAPGVQSQSAILEAIN